MFRRPLCIDKKEKGGKSKARLVLICVYLVKSFSVRSLTAEIAEEEKKTPNPISMSDQKNRYWKWQTWRERKRDGIYSIFTAFKNKHAIRTVSYLSFVKYVLMLSSMLDRKSTNIWFCICNTDIFHFSFWNMFRKLSAKNWVFIQPPNITQSVTYSPGTSHGSNTPQSFTTIWGFPEFLLSSSV